MLEKRFTKILNRDLFADTYTSIFIFKKNLRKHMNYINQNILLNIDLENSKFTLYVELTRCIVIIKFIK